MKITSYIQKTIHQSAVGRGRIFSLFIQSLIVLSLIAFSLETLPGISPRAIALLHLFELLTVMIFTVEYGMRIIAAPRKLEFIFSFYGLIDLLAIAPFYLSTGLDLRSVRVFRLLRLLRIFKLARYNKAFVNFYKSLREIREELILFFVITLMFLYVSSVGIYYCEREAQPEHFESIFHSMWWSISTLTTVGYGDVYPVTTGGRVFTSLILITGLGIIAVPSGLLASALTKRSEERDEPKGEDD